MMKIVFDLLSAQPAGKTKFHGGGEYIKTVFRYLVNEINKEEIHVCFDKSKFVDSWIIDMCEQKKIVIENTKTREEIIAVLKNMSSEKVIFFAGLVYAYRNCTIPSNVYSIGTCHGLRAIEKPYDKYQLKYIEWKNILSKEALVEYAQFFARKIIKKRHDYTYASSISRFDQIITDSEHSLYSIQLNYPDAIKDKKPVVLYPMTQMVTIDDNNIQYPDDGYIMIVSANRWIKNSYRAVRAIDELYSKGLLIGIKTKIFGGLPQRIKGQIRNKKYFEFYNYVSSEDLEEAYSHCSIFIYPTLNEGFGNVPTEAMKYGKTCIVSAICSLPEVYQNSVIYCNPYDIMEIQNRILQAIDNRIDRQEIDKRLKYLKKRQIDDMRFLCSLIKGEKVINS